MAKDYAAIYNSTNDSSALEQRFYLKQETAKGTLIGPTDTDFLYTLGGGSISFNQPFESSPHRSGRHHTDIIKKKKELSWSFSTFFNIDTGAAQGTAELDPAARVLWKSLMGKEDTSGAGVVYTSATAPDITFSLHEVGDKWARQARACFVEAGNAQFPGDGEATVEWSGNGKDSFLIGIGKTTTNNNTGNTITVQTDEGKRFKVGGLVMLIESDGTTRSADTAAGSYRAITDVTGDIVTVDGAVLADADGSASDMYLVYAEPETPTAINEPITGLEGSVTIVGLSSQCTRSASINMTNGHEVVDYCFGEDSLASPFFVPGSRFTAEVSIEMNLNDDIVEFFNDIVAFTAQDITLILGDATTRHLQVEAPNVNFPVPAFAVPETGSIPITFTGNAYQTALDAADEVTVSYL